MNEKKARPRHLRNGPQAPTVRELLMALAQHLHPLDTRDRGHAADYFRDLAADPAGVERQIAKMERLLQTRPPQPAQSARIYLFPAAPSAIGTKTNGPDSGDAGRAGAIGGATWNNGDTHG